MRLLQSFLLALTLMLVNPAVSFSSPFPSPFFSRKSFLSSSVSSTSTPPPPHPKTALIMIDHGSPMKEANDRLAALSVKLDSLLRSTPRCNIVHVSHCHMELSSPTLHEAVLAALSANPSLRRVVVHPYFLGQGKHVTLDIPRIVESVRENVIRGYRRAKNGGSLPRPGAGATAESAELADGFWEGGEIIMSGVVGSEEELMLKTVLQAVSRAVGDVPSPSPPSSSPKAVVTSDAPAAIGPYSQGVVSNNFLFVSGCLGLDPKSGDLAKGVEAQAARALQNLKAIIDAEPSFKGSTRNVVKTTVFLKDMDDFQAFNAVYKRFFEEEEKCVTMPARSCFAVKELPKGGLVEIEAIVAKG